MRSLQARQHKTPAFILPLLLIAKLLAGGCQRPTDFRELHFNTIVADGHNDSVGRIVDSGLNLAERLPDGHIDLPRLFEGNLKLPFFAAWVDPQYISNGPHGSDQSAERVDAMIDAIAKLIRDNPDKLGQAENTRRAQEIIASGKIAIAMGIEGGHAIEDRLELLDHFAARGIRYMTLTWNNSTNWATSALAEVDTSAALPFRGLTAFGKQVIRRMNELGMMVDVSHVGAQTFWDALATTNKPVIASHSSVHRLCPHFRNLRDEQIKAVAKNRGVILINFYAGFLDSTYHSRLAAFHETHRTEYEAIRLSVQAQDSIVLEYRVNSLMQERFGDELEQLRPPFSVLIDHIDYVARLVGPDYVGLGSDFDGITALPQEIDDVTDLPRITKALQERGWSDEAIRKILGGNLLRVWRANEEPN